MVDLGTFLAPASAVVVGASPRNGVAGQLVINLTRPGSCRVTGIHPTNTELHGVPVVADFAALDHVPEVAALALGATTIVPAFEAALAHGIRHVVVPGLGPETGPDGATARAALARLAADADASIIGPNCMGIGTPGAPSAWIGTILPSTRPGHVATLVESGSIGEALFGMGPRVGLRTVVSSGNEIAGDAADWLAWFADDAGTRAVGLFLETVRRPAAFEAALRAAAEAGKDVAVLKTGRSTVGAERALAHSGAIAGSDRAFDALLDAYGAIRADDYSDWLEILEVLGGTRRPRGPRLVYITNSGGEGELLADNAERAGIPVVPLPASLSAALDRDWPFHGVANPIDYYAVAEQAEILPAIARACAAHPDVDGVVLNIDQSLRFEGHEAETNAFTAELAASLATELDGFVAVASTATADPFESVQVQCAAAGVPVLLGSLPTQLALAAVIRHAPRVRVIPPVDAPAVATPAPGALAEFDAKAFLASYGVRSPVERRCATADEAIAAAEAIGFPVAVKVDGPAHKEAVGGVVLGCASAAAVVTASERLGGRVLVAQELRGGVEVLCGMVRDAHYGPIVICGVGGSWAEALKEQARAALAPLTQAAARELVAGVVPLARRLDDAGIGAVADVLVALGRVAGEHPRVAEIDVNPLRVAGSEAVALDALVVVSEG